MKKPDGIISFESRQESMIGTWRDGNRITLAVKVNGTQVEIFLETFEAEKLVNQLAGHIMLLTGAMPAITPEEV